MVVAYMYNLMAYCVSLCFVRAIVFEYGLSQLFPHVNIRIHCRLCVFGLMSTFKRCVLPEVKKKINFLFLIDVR